MVDAELIKRFEIVAVAFTLLADSENRLYPICLQQGNQTRVGACQILPADFGRDEI